MLCVKMCEYLEHVLDAQVCLNGNTFMLNLKVDIDSFCCFGTFLCLSPLRLIETQDYPVLRPVTY